jgi:hypothetical protein
MINEITTSLVMLNLRKFVDLQKFMNDEVTRR